jgi:hypothetical protein
LYELEALVNRKLQDLVPECSGSHDLNLPLRSGAPQGTPVTPTNAPPVQLLRRSHGL